jgi:hypothetical protein
LSKAIAVFPSSGARGQILRATLEQVLHNFHGLLLFRHHEKQDILYKDIFNESI